MFRRAAIAIMMMSVLSSATGCHCLRAFRCCLKQKFFGCGCGHCGACAPCGDSCGCGSCGASACGCDGCGEMYMGDTLSVPGNHCDPCDRCGNWMGPGQPYGGQPYGGQLMQAPQGGPAGSPAPTPPAPSAKQQAPPAQRTYHAQKLQPTPARRR